MLATGTLRTAPTTPLTARSLPRTCYSPRVIGAAEVTDKQRDSIGALTFDAGHHTVYQHANFEFGLENISRQFVWTFLHSYLLFLTPTFVGFSWPEERVTFFMVIATAKNVINSSFSTVCMPSHPL